MKPFIEELVRIMEQTADTAWACGRYPDEATEALESLSLLQDVDDDVLDFVQLLIDRASLWCGWSKSGVDNL